MSDLPLNQILCGNCVEVLKDFPDKSIDLVVTDPPYGLSFMGKDWDKTLPPREAFEEIIRILKPGALAFVMSSPRQDLLWRMLAMLEGVGFELTQSYIDWIYKTGFPKAYDVSKGIDKKLGLERDVVGFRKGQGNIPNIRGEWGLKSNTPVKITNPNSELAKKWDGWKSQTGLKPAHEPILMVNKSFSESTIVDNVLRWGTGAINVDACRIPFQNEGDLEASTVGFPRGISSEGSHEGYKREAHKNNVIIPSNPKGRFPANLLISDRAIDDGTVTKSGKFESHHKIAKDEQGHSVKNVYGKYDHLTAENQISYGDEGGKSRYFDLDAWAKHHGFLDVPKPDNKERNFGLYGMFKGPPPASARSKAAEGRKNPLGEPRANYHPTVKPVKLMAYLIELGCPPNGVVLDPFVGSGTTCIAAKQLVRKFIGIEVDPKYHALAKARIEAYPVPLSWFSGSETKDVLVPPRGGNDE